MRNEVALLINFELQLSAFVFTKTGKEICVSDLRFFLAHENKMCTGTIHPFLRVIGDWHASDVGKRILIGFVLVKIRFFFLKEAYENSLVFSLSSIDWFRTPDSSYEAHYQIHMVEKRPRSASSRSFFDLHRVETRPRRSA